MNELPSVLHLQLSSSQVKLETATPMQSMDYPDPASEGFMNSSSLDVAAQVIASSGMMDHTQFTSSASSASNGWYGGRLAVSAHFINVCVCVSVPCCWIRFQPALDQPVSSVRESWVDHSWGLLLLPTVCPPRPHHRILNPTLFLITISLSLSLLSW